MTVNNGGNLSSEYFSAYLKLVMNAKECSIEEAQKYLLVHFFGGNVNSYGKYSYSNYLKAVDCILSQTCPRDAIYSPKETFLT